MAYELTEGSLWEVVCPNPVNLDSYELTGLFSAGLMGPGPGILADHDHGCTGFAAEWSPQSPIDAMVTVCASMFGRVEPRLAWRRGEPRETGLHGVNDLNHMVQTQPACRVAR